MDFIPTQLNCCELNSSEVKWNNLSFYLFGEPKRYIPTQHHLDNSRKIFANNPQSEKNHSTSVLYIPQEACERYLNTFCYTEQSTY